METIRVKDHLAFSDQGPVKSVFYDADNIKAQTVCLQAGQSIPPCTMEHDVLFYFIDGSGRIIVDGDVATVHAGTCAVVPKTAQSRSIEATTNMKILAVQAVVR
jgi:quercetin dioxygenase-like cupin family protein